MKNSEVDILVEYEEWCENEETGDWDWRGKRRIFKDLVLFFLWAANSEQMVRRIQINGEYAYDYDEREGYEDGN